MDGDMIKAIADAMRAKRSEMPDTPIEWQYEQLAEAAFQAVRSKIKERNKSRMEKYRAPAVPV